MKATVIATVYNQAPFLKQMIESVISQKTDFAFEFIIANDCSTDNSANIIEQYSVRYPCIRFINNPKNLGFIKNYTQCLEAARGTYIAGIGGDDFWIDSLKLQMQVDFLENNEDYGMVHTQFDELYMYRKFLQSRYKKNVLKDGNELQGSVFRRIAFNNTINAVTVCFVAAIIKQSALMDKFRNEEYLIEDLPMWLEISRNFKVGYIDKSTVCYRRNKNSISHFKDIDKYRKYMEYVKGISFSYLNDTEKKDKGLQEEFAQTEYLSNTYYYFKKGDKKKFVLNYKRLNQKPFDRKVMLWVLRFRLSFLFR